ncbi:MAG: hypothetical protein ACYTF7_02720 [Planctomycetota bacterium]|jgi:hypothetical protein
MEMLSRLILILILVWQPLTLLPTGALALTASECAPSVCHVLLERVSCCGERTVEKVCVKSGGECLCVSAPLEEPDTQPVYPQPRAERDSPVAITDQLQRAGVRVAVDPMVRRTRGSLLLNLQGRTHNEIQALLGIWRT